MDIDWYAAAVVGYSAGTVGIKGHADGVAEAGKRLIDRVVDDLVDHVMETRAVVGIADVHAGPLAYGIEAAQHLDRLGAVLFFRALENRFAHDPSMPLRQNLHAGASVASETATNWA